MYFKKIRSILTTVLLAVAVAICITACGHKHSYSEWNVETEPTCTTHGTRTRICTSCGKEEYRQMKALGHTDAISPAVAETCTTEGKTEGKYCSVCEEILVAQTTVPAPGHQYNNGEITVIATCNQKGTLLYTCTAEGCQHSYTEQYSLPSYTATELYEQSVKYVGEIVTYTKSGAELALGTGFVISSDGKIVTNFHVIENAYSAKITINNVTYQIASVLAYDENIDLAILKINASGLDAATICKKAVSVGSTVYAIGSSRGLTNTYSQGIVTYADRVVSGVSHIQHDASITHGNSGGPLINIYGEVIGINTWGISDSQNLNFAVFTGELDNLVYGTPKTMSQMYNELFTPYKQLLKWVKNNYNAQYSNGKIISAEYASEGLLYSISYDFTYDCLYIDIYDDALYFSLDLEGEPTAYEYYLNYEYSGYEYEVLGKINANTYTANTALRNYEYRGQSYVESTIVNLAQSALISTVEFFEYFLNQNNFGLTIEDFGFLAFN